MEMKRFGSNNLVLIVHYDETKEKYQFRPHRDDSKISELDKVLFLYAKGQVKCLSSIYDKESLEIKPIMTPDHKNWTKFIILLSAKMGSVADSNCDNTLNRPIATNLLKNVIDNVDVERSLEYMAQQGGCCDCEILMNVNG